VIERALTWIDGVSRAYPDAWTLTTTLAGIVAITLPLILTVAFYTYFERKVIGYMQVRLGPNQIGPLGLLQPFADVFKMLFKEIAVPANANRFLYFLAPILVMAPAFAAWAVVPFDDGVVLADLNVGILYLLAMTSMSVYGIILAGWASNSKYAFLGAMRSAAQVISYEIAMGFALLGVLILAGSLNLSDIVLAQAGDASLFEWFWLPLLPLALVYFISGIAETNRAPFDVAEGESEIVAGFHVEYGGAAFAVFFLAEYASMILISFLTAILFFGGWLSPLQGLVEADAPRWVRWLWEGGWPWLFLKAMFFMFAFLWIRATFPRYRYDQIMRLGWKVFIPVTLAWVAVAACLKFWRIVVGGA